MDLITVVQLVLAAAVGAIIYGLVVRALPGRQPLEDQVDKLTQAIKDAAAKAQEAANKANTASIIAAKAAQTAANATPAPVEPVSPPVATPPPPAVPAPPKPVPVPVPETPPAVTALPALLDNYIDRDDLMKRLGQGYPYAVTIDGKTVHPGFGPPDVFFTWPTGAVSRTPPQKPAEDVEVPIEGT